MRANGAERRGDKPVIVWLLCCSALVFAMVILGGVTRLTNSGLSMVEWAPIMGVVPPLSDSDWRRAFAAYQQYPEYRQRNAGMGLGDFKQIFLVEYAHRMLGRLIALAFVLPLVLFALSRRLPPGLMPKLLGMLVLGAAQGLLGWYMVKSGLVDQPHVSPYRLTAHLALACAIYVFMLWTVLDLAGGLGSAWTRGGAPLRTLSLVCVGLVLLMIVSGGFVAGTRAGFAFNTFPTMHGHWLPPGLLALDPWWRNLFENVATVQFIHRGLAAVLAVTLSWFCWRLYDAGCKRFAALLLLVLTLQIGLGIATLLHVVPITLAAAHQAGAMMLLTTVLAICHALWRPRAQPHEPRDGPGPSDAVLNAYQHAELR